MLHQLNTGSCQLKEFLFARSMTVLILLTVCIPEVCDAQVVDSAILDRVASRANVIVVARLKKYVNDPDTLPKYDTTPGKLNAVTGNTSLSWARVRVTYSFEIFKKMRGECPDTFDLYCAPINARDSGDPLLRAEVGACYLLFMEHEAKGRMLPFEVSLGPIPVSHDTEMLKSIPVVDGSSALGAVVALLIRTLSDPQSRLPAAYMLRDQQNEEVVNAIRPLINDPDVAMQQRALWCLARNQEVDAIPSIAAFEQKIRATGGGSRVIRQLICYNSTEATPYLNELLVDSGSEFTRLNAATALSQNRLADKTSVPFLASALKDPALQGQIAFSAHIMLHRLIPELGPPKQRIIFLKEPRDMEVQAVEKWWADEQAGKHGPPLIRPRSMIPPIPSTQPSPSSGRGPAD